MTTAIRHIILFKLHPNVDENTKSEAIKILKNLSNHKGIIEWEIKESLDKRKGVVIAETGLFSDMESFENYKKSEKHIAAGEFMGKISDWFVADYEESV